MRELAHFGQGLALAVLQLASAGSGAGSVGIGGLIIGPSRNQPRERVRHGLHRLGQRPHVIAQLVQPGRLVRPSFPPGPTSCSGGV